MKYTHYPLLVMELPCMQKRLPIILANASIRLIPCYEIKYIQAKRNYSEIKVRSEKTYTHTSCLKSLASRLCPDYFIRCHKSFIVNTLFIQEIRKKDKQITLYDGTIIPCSSDSVNKLIKAVTV